MKSKSIYWKYLLLKIKYIFLRDSYVCTRWIFIFDSDQAQINSVQPVLYICTCICSIMSLSKMCEFESGTGEWSAYEYNLVLHVLRKKNILASAGLFFHTGWNMLGFLLNC